MCLFCFCKSKGEDLDKYTTKQLQWQFWGRIKKGKEFRAFAFFLLLEFVSVFYTRNLFLHYLNN